MKIAIVVDWLVTYAGAEKVLEQMLKVYPEADIFCLVDFLPEDKRSFILDKKTNTSFIQKLPFAKKKYRSYLGLMPLAIEQLDLSDYNVIISSSHAVAKGVITGPDQLHISYVHSPIRYAWDLQHQYLEESKLKKGIKGLVAKQTLHFIRKWDYRTANGVDYFITNSNYIGRRVWKVYRREYKVVYPPVNINAFNLSINKEEFYLTASRMVPYKKIDLIVKAFAKMPQKILYVIGDGPEYKKIKEVAGENVKLLGYQEFDVLKDYMQRAQAFIFAAEEDFGITPLEAQACGTPVIAYGKGGALETVNGVEDSAPTGVFFNSQTEESIQEAVKFFENNHSLFDPKNCREKAEQFSESIFRSEFKNFIDEKVKLHFK